MSEEEDAAAILNGCNAQISTLKAIKDRVSIMSAAEKTNCRAALAVSGGYVENSAVQGGVS